MITSYYNSTVTRSSAGEAISTVADPPLGQTHRGRRRAVLPRGQQLGVKASPFTRYLPAQGDASRASGSLVGLGRTTVAPGASYPVSDHPNMYRLDWRRGRVLPELQMLLLTNARGEFESRESGYVPIEGQAIVYLFPGVWHRFRPLRSHGWTERWISIDNNAATEWLREGLVTPDRPIFLPTDISKAVAAFDVLAEHVRRQPNDQSESLSRAAMALVRHATGKCSLDAVFGGALDPTPEQPMIADPIVDKAREVIWNHRLLRSLCVNEVARHLPVTRRTLDRRFSRYMGHSVLDEINACRLWRAKRLLEETDHLIKTVSYLAGFPSRERMRLLFLSEEGLTPTEYRDQHSRRTQQRAC